MGFCCCHVFGHLNWQPGCYGSTSVRLIGQSRTSLQTQAGVLWPSWRLLAWDWSDRVTWFRGTSKHTKWRWFWQLVCKADAQLHLCKLWHEIIVDFVDLYSIVLRVLWLNCSVFFTVSGDDSHYTSDGRSGLVTSQSRTHGTRPVRDGSDRGSQSEVRASHSRRRQPSRASQQTRRSSSRWRPRTSSSSSEGSRSPSAGVSGRRRRKSPPLPKPQMFSGKAGEWNSLIFQFAKTACYYGWDQHDKADRLLASLRGKAVDFIRKKPREVQDDYRTLRDTLEQRFGKLEHPTAARRQLSYVRQEEGEWIEDFADRILTKVNEAYPGIDVEMEQDLAKEAFLRGCQNRSAAYAAAEKDPETLQDALEEVQNSVVNLKAFGRGSAVMRQISFAGREEKEEEDSGTEEEKIRKLFEKFMMEWRSERSGPSRGHSAMRCYSCNGLGHMQRDCTEGPSCFGCGEKGHMRADCPKPDSAGGQSRGRGRGRGGKHLN